MPTFISGSRLLVQRTRLHSLEKIVFPSYFTEPPASRRRLAGFAAPRRHGAEKQTKRNALQTWNRTKKYPRFSTHTLLTHSKHAPKHLKKRRRPIFQGCRDRDSQIPSHFSNRDTKSIRQSSLATTFYGLIAFLPVNDFKRA